jgi:PGF-pre-PGF domain-containing protein
MNSTKKSTGKIFSLVFTVALICLMTAAIIPGVKGASPVDLGSAGNYAILTKTGISTTGVTSITGNIGVSPAAASYITGFGLIKDPSTQFSTSSPSTLVVGRVYAADYTSPTPAILTTAISNMQTAYVDAAGRAIPDTTELYMGNLGGRTLAPGLYKWSTGVLIPASTALTLDAQGNGNAVWIFQVAGDLTMNSASRIVLINGARAENVFWQIGGGTGVTIEPGAHAEGNILAAKAITMKSGASLNGRALAQTAVTLIANTITAPTPTPVPAQTAVITPAQTAAITPGQTASPSQTAVTTTASAGRTSTVMANVGGNTVVNSVEVTGTGHNDLIITGTVAHDPGQNISPPPGIVYQYFDLVPARYTTIDRAVLSFTVPISWLDSHHIAPQNVVLYRLTGTTWTALPTTFVKTDGSLSRYTAATPGFTRFAITGQNTPVAATVQTSAPASQSTVAGTPVATQITAAQPAQPTLLSTTQSPVPVWVPVSAVISALLIMAVLSGRKGKNS